MRIGPPPASRADVSRWRWLVVCAPLFVGVGCVSPDTFDRSTDGGAVSGDGGHSASGSGGTTAGTGGTSGGGLGGAGPGAGGRTGVGGAIGAGGRTTSAGQGGATVVGPVPNLMDGFETGNVGDNWIAPQSSATLSGTKTPCGVWAVATDGATTNHVYRQTSTTCTSSNPTWAAGGSIAWTDMRLQLKVQFPAGATTATIISIGVRYQDPSNVYLLEFSNDGKTKLRSRIGSSSSDVTSDISKNRVPVMAGQWVTIGISISGGTLNAYIGEDRSLPPVLTGTVAGLSSGGVAFGVNNQVAAFDDVSVTAP